VRLLLEPRNAVVRQFQALFAMEGAVLEFTEEALAEIAREALRKDTGARAVRGILESFMLDLLYELPGTARGWRFTVTPETVRREAPPRKEPLPRDGGSRDAAVRTLPEPEARAGEADERRESA
jgi:ATP-dependent Clp protease ATP-binding subunit ClpX